MTALNKQALKPGLYAILFRNNWDGEGDTYEMLASLDANLIWHNYETGKELFEYEGDEILKSWLLNDSTTTDALEAAEKRIAELEAQSAPESFSAIGKNILSQDNRITSDPMFCVYQKSEIVVDADYDYDRIVWVDEDGNEANERQQMRLELLHENFREPPEKWRRVALKEIDDFVTCCFTEQGCKDYLACNGHNLRLPFIYVKSGFRNAEFISVRNWLAGIGVKGE